VTAELIEHALAADALQAQRVLVVDEYEVVQEGLCAILTEQPWVSACLVASTAESAWQIARRQHPQVVLISSSLADGAALVLCRLFRDRMPHVRVVLTTGEGRVSAATGRLHGAVGAVSKHLPTSAIADAIRRVVSGDRVFARAAAADAGVRLGRRELEVLGLVASGHTNGEIAAALCLSRHTIKQCVSEVFRKLEVRNRAEASSRARELGLLR
jgi:DNA-binding NarL/FixJ family response regulator